jgi:2-oxoglutarate dehydrogenase E1 component
VNLLSSSNQTTQNKLLALQKLPLFRGLSDSDILRIANTARFVDFDAGHFVCRQGEIGRDLYIITTGSVVIQQGNRVLARLGTGDVVGELAVLDDQPRSADVITVGKTRLLEIRGTKFSALLESNGSLARQMLRVLAGRVRNTSAKQERVDQLIRSYRERGHINAQIDPLGLRTTGERTELTLEYNGLGLEDLNATYTATIGSTAISVSLEEIIRTLRGTYCDTIGWQYTHIDDLRIQNWLRERIEDPDHWHSPNSDEQIRILTKLTDAEIFESFLQKTFISAKRFSLEGAETLIPLLEQVIEESIRHEVTDIIIGMPHRGRLNVLANILDKPVAQIFSEFDDAETDRGYGSGDVKYHMGFTGTHVSANGHEARLSLCFNPSHLEFVGPVVLGRCRARHDLRNDGTGTSTLPVVIHGDAAFAGQGIIQELFNLSNLPGYSTGGAVHIVLNNQIGFTTLPQESRSSHYATDVARMLQIPIFHVSGEQPEAVHRVVQLALEFRAAFHMDVIIDMYCYRRRGHNEQDDPTFTQPVLYQHIAKRSTVRDGYIVNLLDMNAITKGNAEAIRERSIEKLKNELDIARSDANTETLAEKPDAAWQGYHGGHSLLDADLTTALPIDRLKVLLLALSIAPKGFTPHPRVVRQLLGRQAMANGKRLVDWAAAEALAFASLLSDGYNIRLSGQDSERGTFGHRHAVLHDIKNGERYVPLANITPEQAQFTVINSPLSELAVLGFEYGYSLETPKSLVIWEAQFGDFANAAQVIIDQFIAACEDKWQQLTGICLMLPHGFEGSGPEHSSARIERFLQLAAKDNIQVLNLANASQIFHILRRQMLQKLRKPMIVFTPKGLLQHRSAAVSIDQLAAGKFQPVIDHSAGSDVEIIETIIMCSGRITHELIAQKAKFDRRDKTIVSIEQLYPFPGQALTTVLSRYRRLRRITWVQEEPENMGPWHYISRKLAECQGFQFIDTLSYVARPESASPAVGSKAVHDYEQKELIETAFK